MSAADAAACSRRSSSGTLECAASSSISLTSSRTLERPSTRQVWSTAASSSEAASSTRCPPAATSTYCATSFTTRKTIRRSPSSRAAVERWQPVRVFSSWSDTSPRIPTKRSRLCSLTWRCSSSSGDWSARRTSMRPSWRAAASGSSRPSLWGAFQTRWDIRSSRRNPHEEEHPAPLRVLLLRSVHDRDRLVGPLSRDEGDRHAAVHGAASRVRARDPLRRTAFRAALGPVGTEEDAAAGLDAQGSQLFPPPAVEQLRGLSLPPPHDGDRPQHDLGRRCGAPL